MEGKRGRGHQGKNYWTGWWSRNTANLGKKLNTEKRGAIGGLDMPEDGELKNKSRPI